MLPFNYLLYRLLSQIVLSSRPAVGQSCPLLDGIENRRLGWYASPASDILATSYALQPSFFNIENPLSNF
jgi:hypothetical protein